MHLRTRRTLPLFEQLGYSLNNLCLGRIGAKPFGEGTQAHTFEQCYANETCNQ